MKNMNKLRLGLLLIALTVGISLAFAPDLLADKKYNRGTGIRTIVIDPGHGGHDSGCHGASAHEKNIALAVSLKLGKLIEANFPDVKVIYTRKTDVFVELYRRAQIANENKADLFICIHCNSGPKAAFGAETFVMGLHKSEDNLNVAKRENAVILQEDNYQRKYDGFDPNSAEANIIFSLYQNAFLDQSLYFADRLQHEFKHHASRHNRGVKQAGFLVLYRTTMPSVLIETGFLTNPNEEKFLADADGQLKMANAMFTAFEQYKNEIEGISSKTTSSGVLETQVVDSVQSSQIEETSAVRSDKVYFRVQIETSETKISTSSSKFKGLPVREYKQDNLYKYTVGDFENDLKSANAYKNEMRNGGFPHAFVVAFQNGERINLEKAIKLAQK